VRICYSVRWLFSASVRALPGNASINICVNQLVFVPCLYVQEVPQEYIGSTLRPQYPAIHACSAPLATLPSYNTLVLWTHSNSSPKSPTMSSSECSLLEEQTQERPRFCKEFAIPPRVQRSTGLVHEESASGYVLILSDAFDLIASPDSTRGFPRGWAGLFLLVTADRDDPARSVASMKSSMKSSFQVIKVMFSTTLVASRLAAKTS